MADLSAVSICNMALADLGQVNGINSLTQPGNKLAALCNQWYDQSRREALAAAPWQCCKRWKTGVLVGTEPMPPWLYAFAYPADALRIHFIKRDSYNDPVPPMEISQQASSDARQINTNMPSPVFVYSADVENVARFDADFVHALRKLLAYNMCMMVTKSAKMQADLQKQWMGMTSVALAAAFNENVEDVDKEPFYQAVR